MITFQVKKWFASGGSTGVEHLSPHPKVKGSIPNTTVGIGQEKMALNMIAVL
jgi:hypothetical protein